MSEKRKIALAGNPNTGKSTVFNALTGLRQHTGNWSGKTVGNAVGYFSLGEEGEVALYDLPGIYSLFSDSAEECAAKNFICFEEPEMTIVILDATSLERNLPLGLQVMEMTQNVVFCLNLTDEAEKKGISINKERLEVLTGVPVIKMAARQGKGIGELKEVLARFYRGEKVSNPILTDFFAPYPQTYGYMAESCNHLLPKGMEMDFFYGFLLEGEPCLLRQMAEKKHWDSLEALEVSLRIEGAQKILMEEGATIAEYKEARSMVFLERARKIAQEVTKKDSKYGDFHTEKIDKILLSKRTGIPFMLLLLGLVFWITVAGANVPSDLLMRGFQYWGGELSAMLMAWNTPLWLESLLMDGVYLTVSWVVAVMLPPMAIFFPLFTLLEDFGLLPRIAFNLDGLFQKAGAHGKQALTMSMGFGCNAAGVTACRIIESPRERLIAILTNTFVPCNGRFAP